MAILWDQDRRLAQLTQLAEQEVDLLEQVAGELGTLNANFITFFNAWKKLNAIGPVKGVLSIGGNMPLSIDTTPGSESVDLGFEDAHGNAATPPVGDGSGLVVTITSSDDTQATVGATVPGTAPIDFTAPITVVTTVPGSVTFSVSLSNTSGAPLNEDDGTTPFAQPDPITVPITGGEAVAGSLSVAAT